MKPSSLTLRNMILFAHVFMIFCCFFSPAYSQVFLKQFVFDFTIPFTSLEIMKVLILVEHPLTTGF